jgi:hypothetical protein
VSGYPDYQALNDLKTFITDLSLATTTLQATAEQIANEIEAIGVPLLAKPVNLYDSGEITVAAGETGHVIDNASGDALTDMGPYLSYELAITQVCDSTADVPFLTYNFNWYGDSAGTKLIYQDKWTLPGSSNAALETIGAGPVRAAYLQVTMNNESQAHAQYMDSFYLYGNARPSPMLQPDFRTLINSGYTVPGFNLPSKGNNTDGILGIFPSLTIAASGKAYIMCGTYNGQSNVTFIPISGGSPDYQVTQYAQIAGYELNTIGDSLVETGDLSFTANSPRSPMIFEVKNLSASASIELYIIALAIPQL